MDFKEDAKDESYLVKERVMECESPPSHSLSLHSLVPYYERDRRLRPLETGQTDLISYVRRCRPPHDVSRNGRGLTSDVAYALSPKGGPNNLDAPLRLSASPSSSSTLV